MKRFIRNIRILFLLPLVLITNVHVISQTVNSFQSKNLKNISYTITRNNKFIVFSRNGLLLSVCSYLGTDSIDAYGNKKAIIDNSIEDPIFFEELYADIIVYNEGTSPLPYRSIYFYDLVNKKQLLQNDFTYIKKRDKTVATWIILKKIEEPLNQDQKNMLDYSVFNEVINETKSLPNNAYTSLGYYDEYVFKLDTRELIKLDKIYTYILY